MGASIVRAIAALATMLAGAPQGPTEGELAAARWIAGRVVLPEGTPAGERIRVEAVGREFADGARHSVEVGADGRFRVAVPPSTRTLRLALHAPHLFLEPAVWLRVADLPEEARLAPALGGRLSVRMGFEPDAGSVALHAAACELDEPAVDTPAIEPARAPDGAFLFDALSAERRYRLTWSVEGEPGSLSGIGVRRAATLALTLAPTKGASQLRGTVADERGDPIAGALVRGGNDARDPRSGADGRFARALEHRFRTRVSGGERREAWIEAEDFVPLRVVLAGSAAHPLAVEAVLVLRESPSLAGRVVQADGTPAAGWRVEARRADRDADAAEDDAFLAGDESAGIALERIFLDDLLEDLQPLPPPAVVSAGVTDADGRFALRVATAGALRVACWGTRAGERWTAERSGVTAAGAPLELVLARGATLTGRVLDERGEPVQSGVVRATRGAGESAFDVVERAFASADGGFALDGLQDGAWTVEGAGADHLSVVSAEALVTGGRCAAPELSPLTVQRAARVRGRVVGADGRPLAGAALHAYAVNTLRVDWWPDAASAEADADGVFELTRVLPAGVQIDVSAPGHVSRLLTVELAPAQTLDLGSLELVRGVRLDGMVSNPSGTPCAGLAVELHGIESVMGSLEETLTDAAGRFAFECLGPGPYEVVLPHHLLPTVVPVEIADVDASLAVRHPAAKALTVIVAVVSPRGPLRDTQVLLSRRGGIASALTRMGAELAPGSHELVVPPGDYDLSVLDETGVLLARVPCTVPRSAKGKRHAVTVEVASGSVRVNVTSKSGADFEFEPVWIEPADWMDPLPFGPAELDVDHWVFRGLPDGRYRVLAGSSDFSWRDQPGLAGTSAAEVEVRDGRRAIARLDVPRGATLAGAVRSAAGALVPAARVRAWTAQGVSLDLVDFGSNALGRFATCNLPADVWIAASSGTSASRPQRVRLDPSAPTELDLVLGPATMVDVRILDAAGRPARALVQAVDEQGLPYRTLQERRAVSEWDASDALAPRAFYDAYFLFLGPLPPGRYRVQAKTLDGRRGETELEITGAGERSLEVGVR